MAIKSNLAAWTPAEENPPYISINYNESTGGKVEITVRERTKEKGILGQSVMVSMTVNEFVDLITQLENNILANHENLFADKRTKK